MKVNYPKSKLTWIAICVAQITTITYSYADDEEVNKLKLPENIVEAGVLNTSSVSNKFGEYNGLSKGGSSINLNINAKGGAGYTNNENGEIRRWSVEGENLGLSSRALGARISNQGEWSFGIKYDELEHVLTQGYQTPYSGTMGGNRWTTSLPAISSTNASAFGTAGLAAQPSYPTISNNFTPVTGSATPWSNYLTDMTVSSTRKNSTVSASYLIDGQSSVEFEFNQLRQTGAKLSAMPSAATATSGTLAVSGEKMAYLPNPTNYQTDTLNFGYNWKGDRSRFSVNYFGSYFRDGFDATYFQPFFVAATTTSPLQAISTAPNNTFNQLSSSAGFDFSKQLKLTGNFSWGEGLQNAGFNSDVYTTSYLASNVATTSSLNAGTVGMPSSLNGKVNNTHLDLKLIDLYSTDLTLTGTIRYDERLNKTASTFYKFYGLDYGATHIYNYPNAPFSNRKTLVEFAGDYKFNQNQKIRIAVGQENIQRWCDNYASSSGVAAGASGYYPAGTSCVVATGSRDDKLDATFKQKVSADTDMKLGYQYSKRQSSNNASAITDMIGTNGNIALGSATLPSSPILGLNGGDYQGFYPYFSASKEQHSVKASSTSQLDDRWALSVGGKISRDHYGDSTYGVQSGMSSTLSTDLTFAYSENRSIFGYATQQFMRRDALSKTVQSIVVNGVNLSNQDVTWFNSLNGSDLTLGFGLKDDGLLGGRLTLAGDLNYSWARTSYATAQYYTLQANKECYRTDVLTCGSVPDIQYIMTQLKFNGLYRFNKESRVNLSLLYQHLSAQDYYYNGLQTGYTPTSLVPNNLNAGGYNVRVLGLSYVLNF